MSAGLYIEIEDRTLGDRFVVACAPPLRIGKQSGIGNTILLDRQHETVSRSHGLIDETRGKLTYTDVSSNGTRVGGVLVQRSQVTLPDRFEIEIGPCILRRVDPHGFVLVVTDQKLKELRRAEVLPGRGLAIVTVGGDIALADLNRWSQRQTAAELRVTLVDGAPMAVLESGTAVTLNRGNLPIGITALAGGDVLSLGDRRIEILKPGSAYSVCSNGRCHLLNPHGAEANCRWCGYHLAGTGAISRIIT